MSTDVLDMFPGIEQGDVTTKPANVLSNDKDLSFLDRPGAFKLTDTVTPDAGTGGAGAAGETPEAKAEREKKEAEAAKGGQAPAATPTSTAEADKILNSINIDEGAVDDDDEGAAAAGGDDSKKIGRDGITSYLKTKIEAGDFSAFEDYDEKKETLDAYLAKQPIKTLHQMLDANWEAKEKDLLERTPKEFFEALPEELQYAAKYVLDGGTDMKALFGALAQVEQVKALDISTEEGQLQTARAYLQATGFGRGKAEVIEKQVTEWKDEGKLAEKAATFKPDLDDMQKEQVQYRLKQQEDFNRQQKELANAYANNLHKALEKADLNGVKIDRRTQANIFNGLTQLAYPSASGKPTNLLGHMLDKIMYVEPNFALLAEATYLLSDPEGYRKSVMQMGKNDQVAKTVLQLKTEQQTQGGSATIDEGADAGEAKKTRKLTKPKNLFER